MNTAFDAIVVGSGFAGAILAERLASQASLRVLVLERRNHVAGNMFDAPDENGVLVHRYGPHIFRSDSERVIAYLSRFTEWHPYQHRVLASVDGVLVPVPFNLTSLDRLFPRETALDLRRRIAEAFPDRIGVPVSELRRHPDEALARLGQFVFDKIYRNYTLKQWGLPPEKLDFEATTRRVPVRLNEDDRYFQHRFQGLPQDGYTALFQKMLAAPGITVRTGVDALEHLKPDADRGLILADGQPFHGPVIYSGAVDALFGCRFGALPWRALRFEHESLPVTQFQPAAVVNYPNEHAFTRITEFKHMTGQVLEGRTAIAREYPLEFRPETAGSGGTEPCYPILCEESAALLKRYQEEAARIPNLHLLGRLGEYRYYDMNDIVTRALEVSDALLAALPSKTQPSSRER
jgi:UDP-galactopyranose mutase